MEHRHRTIDTVSGLRLVMHANTKHFMHTLPTDMFFYLFFVGIQNQNEDVLQCILDQRPTSYHTVDKSSI